MSLYTETDMSRYAQGFEVKSTRERTLHEQFFSELNLIVREVPSVAGRLPQEVEGMVTEVAEQMGDVAKNSEQVVASGQLIDTYEVSDEVSLSTLNPALRLRFMEQEWNRMFEEAEQRAQIQTETTRVQLEAKREAIQDQIRAITEEIKSLLQEIEQDKASLQILKQQQAQQEVLDQDEATAQKGEQASAEGIVFKQGRLEAMQKQRKELRTQLRAVGFAEDEMEDAQALLELIGNVTVSRSELRMVSN